MRYQKRTQLPHQQFTHLPYLRFINKRRSQRMCQQKENHLIGKKISRFGIWIRRRNWNWLRKAKPFHPISIGVLIKFSWWAQDLFLCFIAKKRKKKNDFYIFVHLKFSCQWENRVLYVLFWDRFCRFGVKAAILFGKELLQVASLSSFASCGHSECYSKPHFASTETHVQFPYIHNTPIPNSIRNPEESSVSQPWKIRFAIHYLHYWCCLHSLKMFWILLRLETVVSG